VKLLSYSAGDCVAESAVRICVESNGGLYYQEMIAYSLNGLSTWFESNEEPTRCLSTA
jgi:antibiotic biosynthesis monooxygenase (ABM) superfamily enzyme